jgi:hypothetical protein
LAKQLTVNGETFDYPENRDSPGWGEDATAWAEAVTTVCSNVSGSGDILQTSATIANNQSSAANVTGLSFDPATVRAAIVEYSVYRITTSTGATERAECGQMYINYKSTAAAFELVVVGSGGSNTTFSITSGGQVQYVTDNQSGSSYSGTMKFRARAFTI